MKKTLVAATRFEINSTIDFLEGQSLSLSDQWEILITGIGSTLTAYSLTKHIQQKGPSLLIQAGIAGAFTHELRPGSVVTVAEERMGDLGVEEKGQFKDVFDMGFIEADEYPFSSASLQNPHLPRWQKFGLPAVKALTVNEITTNQQRISQLQAKYAVAIETMEGAAFHYVALQENVPFLQLRSISNFVGERDKNNWQLRHAVEQLNITLQQMITEHSL